MAVTYFYQQMILPYGINGMLIWKINQVHTKFITFRIHKTCLFFHFYFYFLYLTSQPGFDHFYQYHI